MSEENQEELTTLTVNKDCPFFNAQKNCCENVNYKYIFGYCNICKWYYNYQKLEKRKKEMLQFQNKLCRKHEKEERKRWLRSERVVRKFNKNRLNPLSLVKINLTGILQNLERFVILTEANKQYAIKDCIERTHAIAKALKIKVELNVNNNL